MSVLVETLEDDVPTILLVAQFIGELTQEPSQRTELADSAARKLVAECEAMLERAQPVAVLTRLLEQVPALLSKASPPDAETCLLLMANLVPRLPQQAALEAAHALCIALTADASATAAPLRLRVLMALFNLMPQPYGRYTVLMRVLAYASASGQAAAVAAVAKRVEGWVKEWALSVEDERALYLALSAAFNGSKEHLAFLLKYLTTFENGTAAPVEAVREQAMAAAVEFLKVDDRFQCDMLDLQCVQPLLKDAKAGPVFALLKVMLEGKLGDLAAFLKSNGAAVKALGLSEEGLKSKMRLMSLAALGTESNSGEIAYAQVKDTLQVSAEEVETWIVKAIGLKLLEAKMDQLREVVVFNRCTQRVFADAQWTELRAKLQTWKGNLGGVTSMVAKQRVAQAAMVEREAKMHATSMERAAAMAEP